jgi:LuxR family quorum-sensing system transcriptional regulator CciR
LEKLVNDITREMSFDNFSMFQHVSLSRVSPTLGHIRRGELLGLTSAAMSWAEFYRDNNFVRVDPRVLASRRTTRPFETSEISNLIPVTATQRDVVEAQGRADIGDGFTIPVHFPGEPTGSCTFSVTRGRSLPRENFPLAQWVAVFAFDAGRQLLEHARHGQSVADTPRLTQRQLDCTVLLGRGLTEHEIGNSLGIARETVKRHLKEARQAFGVSKSIQLVTQSLQYGLISLEDILDDRT